MKRFYNYIYFYTFSFLKLEKNRAGKAYAASFLLSVFIAFNIASVIYLIKVHYDWTYNFKLIYVLIYLLISMIHLLVFNKNAKYERVLKEIDERRPKSRVFNRSMKGLLIAYFVLSILFLAYAILIDAVVGDFRIIFNYLEQKFFIKR